METMGNKTPSATDRRFEVEETENPLALLPCAPRSDSWIGPSLLPIAGLFIAACFAWLTCPLPGRNLLSSILFYVSSSSQAGLIGVAVLYVAVTACISLATLLLARMIAHLIPQQMIPSQLRPMPRGKNRGDRWQVVFRSVATALCLPPLVMAASVGATWISIGLTVILAITLIRLLPLRRHAASGSDSALCLGLLFGYDGSFVADIPFWRFGGPFVSAISAQLGTAAAAAGHEGYAAGLLALSAAVLTWYISQPSDAASDSSPAYIFRRALRLLVAALFAVIFIIAGMVQYMVTARGSGGGSAPFSFLRILFDSSPGGAAQKRPTAVKKSGEKAPYSGWKPGYAGVILVPDAIREATLVVPPQLISSASSSVLPPEIEFTGVYWVFKPPSTEPPKESPIFRGSPDKIGLRSSDRIPLWMEAHQYLGRAIDTNCCSTIQVVIGNQDRYPETVSVELLLSDAHNLTKGPQSLGSRLLQSNVATPRPSAIQDSGQFQANAST